jgi:Cu2+-exporting ATPase
VRLPAWWLRARREPIESAVRALSGVRSASGSPVTGSLLIDYDPFVLAEERLLEQLESMTAHLGAPEARDSAGNAGAAREGLARGGLPLLQLLGASAVLAGTWFPIPSAGLAGLVLASEMPVLLRAVAALQQRRFDGTVLESSALLAMVGRGNYAASALLAWMRSLGELIVAKSVVTTRRSLHELVADPGQRVTRVREGRGRRVRVDAVTAGEVVRVEAGERLPVDGTVVSGEALVSQQSVTGEALPVERRSGDAVFAATTVEAGRIEVRVDRVGLETAVGRIVQAVEAAAREKSEIQLFAERLADRDVGRTLVLAGLGAAFSRSLDAGSAIMVADYGLAARVGIPTAMLASIKHASGSGILVKGPTALENLARVDTVVFDKTGTLTSGTPRVTRVLTYRDDLGERELVRLVAAAEQGFGHPVARAVARLAAELGIDERPPTGPAESQGLGVDVRVDGVRVLVGSRRFMDAQGIALGPARADEAAAHAVGAAPAFVATDGRLAGMLELQDELRADAPAAVAALRARRVRNVIMLSGDHPEPSRVIAESLGLRHHYAELLPEDKARLIRELKAEGRVVAMIGDGVNDTLALREADVGIAVPGGAAVATEVADVVLLSGGLDQVVRALDLSADAIARVRRTLQVATRANLVVVGLASFGLASPVTSILLSHGSTVAAALVSAARQGGTRREASPGAAECAPA